MTSNTTKQQETHQLRIVLLIILIGFMGASLPYPIFSPLFLNPNEFSIVPQNWTHFDRSFYLGITLATYPFGQFLGSPILGGLSDKYGRKPILIITLACSAIGHLFAALAIYYASWVVLIISRFITGVMEGNIAIVQAMVGDYRYISKEESFGKISAIGSIGYVLGPLFGGLLSDQNIFYLFSYSVPFFLASLISFIALILTILILHPNKLSSKKHAALTINIRQRVNILSRLHLLFTNKLLKLLIGISIIFTFGVDIFYEFGPAFLTILWKTSPAEIALYNTVLCIGLIIGSRWMPEKLEFFMTKRNLILFFILLTFLSFFLMCLIENKLFTLFLFGTAGVGIAATTTKLTIQVSNTADSSIQGEALGSLLGLRMLGDAIACIGGGLIISHWASLPIIISCIFVMISLWLYNKLSAR